MEYPFQITSIEQYNKEYEKSVNQPENFWAGIAENFLWKKKWENVLSGSFTGEGAPKVKWFEGGKLNITENCIDRHLE